MENVTLNPKEQARLQVLNSLLAEQMTLDQAATLMGVSPRHTRRILAAYREKGAASVAHGHRGRRAPNATPEAVAYDVVHLARTRYSGANHTHLSELLDEREGIVIGRTTLRRILVNAGLKSPQRRRPPKHRVRRQRMPRQGMLIQMDGSFHPWLGDHVPPFTLLIAVDDATGTVPGARFSRSVFQGGGYPELPPAHERPDQRTWNTLGPLQRPPPGLQVHRRSQRVPSGSHPVRPSHGGTGNSADFRQITPGQGPGRTRRGHLPGPSGNRAQAVRSNHHR